MGTRWKSTDDHVNGLGLHKNSCTLGLTCNYTQVQASSLSSQHCREYHHYLTGGLCQCRGLGSAAIMRGLNHAGYTVSSTGIGGAKLGSMLSSITLPSGLRYVLATLCVNETCLLRHIEPLAGKPSVNHEEDDSFIFIAIHGKYPANLLLNHLNRYN